MLKYVAGGSFAVILLSSMTPDNAAAASDNAAAASTGACATVAGAKSAQWNQKRFMIRETQTFADGRRKVIEAIFTPDAGYARVDQGPWTSMNLVQRQRAAPPAGALVKRMGLQDCGVSGPDANAKQPVSVYSYGYQPGLNTGQVTGRMWIDDSSQLPVRQELAQAEASQRNLPISIEASYTYGDAVTVPSDAVRSDERRRWLEQQIFLQNGRAASSGSGGAEHDFGSKHH